MKSKFDHHRFYIVAVSILSILIYFAGKDRRQAKTLSLLRGSVDVSLPLVDICTRMAKPWAKTWLELFSVPIVHSNRTPSLLTTPSPKCRTIDFNASDDPRLWVWSGILDASDGDSVDPAESDAADLPFVFSVTDNDVFIGLCGDCLKHLWYQYVDDYLFHFLCNLNILFRETEVCFWLQK